MWSRRQRRLLKILVPVLTVFLLINVISLKRFSIQTDFDGHERTIKSEVEPRNEQNKKYDKRQAFSTTIALEAIRVLPFRFYIYELPRSLNYDIADYFQITHNKCFNFTNNGMGEEILQSGNEDRSISVYNTNQFSLEVIIHEKLKRNPLRTTDPEEADLFYIPAYMGLQCISNEDQVNKAVKTLKKFLNNSTYFTSGKPHFSTTAKIQREMGSTLCPYLTQPFVNNITFISIEKQKYLASWKSEWPYSELYKNSLIIAPYPSYGHFSQSAILTNTVDDRDVYILLAVGESSTNKQRTALMEQFETRTKLEYTRFKMCHEKRQSKMVLFYTNDCSQEVSKYLIPWMQHSVFCLQPPGDSPSRKSFYDSLVSGCIPVILTDDDGYNPYSFQEFFDYKEFSISIKMSKISKQGHQINAILQDISKSKIIKMQDKIRDVAKFMQYSILGGPKQRENDALQVIFNQLSIKFGMKYDKKLPLIH